MEPWGFEMENLRAGTIATQVIAPYCKKYDLPKPGDWFSPSGKEPFVQDEADICAVFKRTAKRWKQLEDGNG